MQQYEISQYFEIGPRQNWFISPFLWQCSLWCSTDSCGQFSLITLWIFVFISAHLSNKHHIFRILQNLDNYRYQTRKRNIMTFYLLIPKHLTIQLVKSIFELKYHFLTLQKIFRLLLNKSVHTEYQRYVIYDSVAREIIYHTIGKLIYSITFSVIFLSKAIILFWYIKTTYM